MSKSKVSDQEFIDLWNKIGSVGEIAKMLGLDYRSVFRRRRRIEAKTGNILVSVNKKSPDFLVSYAHNNVRTNVELANGTIVIGSDCHYWPGIISTAHRAFVKIIKDLKPKMVVMNGDVFDGASISRHPVSGWESIPNVKQELETCQERLYEIEKAAKGSALHWTWGNHDQRFNARLAAQVGDGFRGIVGMDLKDHFPMWKFSMSIMVNEHTQIKHRLYNGIHASYNATLKSGVSTVNGHLHSLKVMPWTDLTGTRYGVDTGSLANVWGDQFLYTEDSTRNHRSGFAVLTFYEGKLLPPELCEVLNEDEGLVVFRGEVLAV